MRKPSNSRVSGCTPLTYVVSAYADCDSPDRQPDVDDQVGQRAASSSAPTTSVKIE